MLLKLDVTDEQMALVNQYAAKHSLTPEEAFKAALFERIEDEQDLKAYNDAMAEYRKNPVSRSFKELADELGLE